MGLMPNHGMGFMEEEILFGGLRLGVSEMVNYFDDRNMDSEI